jgi:hypothetical protein
MNEVLIQNVLGDFNPEMLGDPTEELLPFAACRTPVEARAVLREAVEREVTAILDKIAELDAFDLIELIRMREFSIVPDPRLGPVDGASLPVEILAAILVSRPSRMLSNVPREATRPHEVIGDLHERCMKLARMASYRLLAEGRLRSEPIARLASEYQGAVLNIRNLQYDHIRDDHDRALFATPIVRELMSSRLGYSYDDMLSIRTALTDISAERLTRLRDETGEIMLSHPDVHPTELPAEVAARFRQGMISLMFLPADRAIISALDIAKAAGVAPGIASAVLSSFSQDFDSTASAGDRVFDLLTRENLFLTRPLIHDGEGGYALTSNDIGLDILRRLFERSLATNSTDVRRYDQKARQPVSESLAVKYLEAVLGTKAWRVAYHYMAPNKQARIDALGPQAEDLRPSSDEVEGDALFIVDDVAIIVEVKAKAIADQARRGDVKRLTNDLKATVRHGAEQTERLRSLIEQNGGFWERGGQWADLNHVREIRSVVVLLDDIGPLGTNLADLQAASLLGEDRPPLILSLHDLAVIAEIGERPSEFLLYIRRRTDSPVRDFYRALDELDLYTLFLDGDLFVEEDPDEVKAAHPSTADVSKRDRKRRQKSAVGTMVSDNCMQLNTWMVRDRLPEGETVTKPAMRASAEVLRLVDDVHRSSRPGWFRLGADVLSLSGGAQSGLIGSLRTLAERARADRKYHHAVLGYAGMWGYAAIFPAVVPRGMPVAMGMERLAQYVRVKQYQIKADRAYGLLFAEDGALLDSVYSNSVTSSDPVLDELVREMNLTPGSGVPRVARVPPSARRATKRLKRPKKR